MFNWTGPIIRIGKSFNAGAKNRKFFPKIKTATPNQSTNILGRGDNQVLGRSRVGLGRRFFREETVGKRVGNN